jgi:hypothetical protein
MKPGPSRNDTAPARGGVLLGLGSVPFALGSLAILRHEWWRDEAYTWLVVRASSSPADLVARLGFNGHPRAYYLLAYALYHLCPSPLALSLSNLVFALLAIALFVRAAPFPLLHRALFSIGFFPLYQYGVIARSYSLFLVLLFLYAHLKTRWPRHVVLRALCLALLAQIHLISIAAAGVLLFLELAERRRDRTPWSAATSVAVVVVGLSLAGAVYQILPRGAGGAVLGGRSVALVCQGLANGYLPYFDRLRGDLQLGLGLALFALSGLLLYRDGWTLLRYALLCASLIGISALIYHGHRWHHGFYFVYFIVALWLAKSPPRPAVRLLGVVLGLHAAVGVYALSTDLQRPYSNGQAVARALAAQHLEALPLLGVEVRPDAVGQPSYSFQIDEIQPVLLDLPSARAYDPRAGSYETYWRHYTEPGYFAPMGSAELVSRLTDVAARLRSPLVIVTVEHELPDGIAPAPPPLRLLAGFPPSLDYGEHMGLYLFPSE